ncbi:MAG: hypothetical protein JSS30_03380 [Verrucomicrobia bacterium]|nr:hypothetical protein [Verrucomicrobiota bacterium]
MLKTKIFLSLVLCRALFADCPTCSNQTPYFTPPLAESSLPFRVVVETADFSLTNGLHSFAFASYEGEWLLLAGRTNGLHNVDNTDPTQNSFPVSQQNTVVYVVNPTTKQIYSRSLHDPSSLLTQSQIDLLSISNPLSLQSQDKKTLYIVGGYGIDTVTKTMGTKPVLAAIDIAKMIAWVKEPSRKSARNAVRFVFDRFFQVTGGEMVQASEDDPFLLVFGQNFDGNYVQTSEGTYTRQVRAFKISDNGTEIAVFPVSQPPPVPEFRRRDLNVIPIIKKTAQGDSTAFVALSGVFTPGGEADTPGAWTIPVEIQPDGSAKMSNKPFAQPMNNYACPTVGLYLQNNNSMYTLLFGGISAVISIGSGDCNSECQAPIPTSGPNLTPCCNLPFVNDITTLEIDQNGDYRQYLMSAKFPIIQSSLTNDPCTGDPLTEPRRLWFGASGVFIPNDNLPTYPNGVIKLEKLPSTPIVLGHIVGGIASSLTDTNCFGDSSASTYIFKVTLERDTCSSTEAGCRLQFQR